MQNFRSVAGVLDWVNEVFDRVLVESRACSRANTALASADAALADESRSVCVVRGEPSRRRPTRSAQEEARVLAARCCGGWSTRAGRCATARPARSAPHAAATSRSSCPAARRSNYLEAFRRAGVPVRAEGGRSFFQRQEVRDLANVLRAIDDPLDGVALVAALRSSAFGCTDEDDLPPRRRGQPARPARAADRREPRASVRRRSRAARPARLPLARLAGAARARGARAHAARRDRAARLRRQAGGREPGQARRPGARLQLRGRRRPPRHSRTG